MTRRKWETLSRPGASAMQSGHRAQIGLNTLGLWLNCAVALQIFAMGDSRRLVEVVVRKKKREKKRAPVVGALAVNGRSMNRPA